eukprot:COSAG05_NODE_22444_length_265_cov_0.566265_1_plen_36_part_00
MGGERGEQKGIRAEGAKVAEVAFFQAEDGIRDSPE